MQLFRSIPSNKAADLFDLPLTILYGMTACPPSDELIRDINIVRAVEYGFDESDKTTEMFRTVVRCNLLKIYNHYLESNSTLNHENYRMRLAELLTELDHNDVPFSEKNAFYKMLLHYSNQIAKGVFLKNEQKALPDYQLLLENSCQEFEFIEQLLLTEKETLN